MTEADRRTKLQQAFARTMAGRYEAAVEEIRRLNSVITGLRNRETYNPVRHPGRGVAVIACRCGTVLDARDIVRIVVPTGGEHVGDDVAIHRVGCRACAKEAAGVSWRTIRPAPYPREWAE